MHRLRSATFDAAAEPAKMGRQYSISLSPSTNNTNKVDCYHFYIICQCSARIVLHADIFVIPRDSRVVSTASYTLYCTDSTRRRCVGTPPIKVEERKSDEMTEDSTSASEVRSIHGLQTTKHLHPLGIRQHILRMQNELCFIRVFFKTCASPTAATVSTVLLNSKDTCK